MLSKLGFRKIVYLIFLFFTLMTGYSQSVTADLVSEPPGGNHIADFNGTFIDALEDDLLQTALLNGNPYDEGGGIGGSSHGAEYTYNGKIATGIKAVIDAGYWTDTGWIEFNLDTVTSPGGYNLSSIIVIQRGDSHRPYMNFKVSLRKVNSTEFVEYYDTSGVWGESEKVNQLTLSGGNPADLSGIDGVRFDFGHPNPNDSAMNWTWYREIDVVGSAVPELSNLSFILGFFMLAHSTSRRRYLK